MDFKIGGIFYGMDITNAMQEASVPVVEDAIRKHKNDPTRIRLVIDTVYRYKDDLLKELKKVYGAGDGNKN